MTLLRHTVLLQFKPDATEEQIDAVLDGLASMPQKMSFIRRYEFGRDLGHPDHKALVRDSIAPILETMTRVQYEVR